MPNRLRAHTPLIITLVLLALVLVACNTANNTTPPAAPTNVTTTPGPGFITVEWTDNSDNETGSIEVGKLADLAVLDRNLFDIPPEAISETQVLLTLFGGETVHGSLEVF